LDTQGTSRGPFLWSFILSQTFIYWTQKFVRLEFQKRFLQNTGGKKKKVY